MSKLKVNELDTRSGTTITVASGKTLAGTDIVDTAQIATDAITANEIAANAVDTSELATDAVTANEIEAGAVGATEIAATIDLSSKTVTLAAGAVTAHVTAYDDSKLRNDIATLALHSAIADNKAAYNLTNSFLDQFEDDTGIDVETDCDNVSEYMASVQGGGIDAYVKFMAHCDGADGGTTFTDSSASAHAVSNVDGNAHTEVDRKKFGTASIQHDGTGDRVRWAASTEFNLPHNAGSWTLDYWCYDQAVGSHWHRHMGQEENSGTYDGWHLGANDASTMRLGHDTSATPLLIMDTAMTQDTWQHHCWEYDSSGNTVKCWLDGVLRGTTSSASSSANWSWHNASTKFHTAITNPAGAALQGYLDEIRLSKGIARTLQAGDPLYISTGTGFTPPTAAYADTITNATGNFTSTTQTALGTVSKMSIVVLYKNAYGTATLDTDLVAQVSSNGGTNYTSAPLTAAGTFSTGVLMAKSNDITISNTGTAPKYKISFANQAASSKETRVEGVALLY